MYGRLRCNRFYWPIVGRVGCFLFEILCGCERIMVGLMEQTPGRTPPPVRGRVLATSFSLLE